MSTPTHTPTPCDHEWKVRDDSFDHDYGCERIVYQECQLCGTIKECEPEQPEDNP